MPDKLQFHKKDISNIATELLTLLKQKMNNVECRSAGIKFTRSQGLNLRELGNGQGVRNFTVRNTGNFDLILPDAGEVVLPGSSFTIGSPHRIVNDRFEITVTTKNAAFAAESNRPEFVVRYLVDTCS